MKATMTGLWCVIWLAALAMGWKQSELSLATRRQWALACGILALTGVVVYLLSCPL